MKNILLNLVRSFALVGALVVGGLGVVALQTQPVAAAPVSEVQDGVNAIGGKGQTNLTTFIQTIINVLLFVIGAVAVIMIIIGGIRYVVSGGDQAAVTGAKNTILYSVIGLVVALLAYAIVNFVLDNLAKTTTTWNTTSLVVSLK